jgi:hypothetical protein
MASFKSHLPRILFFLILFVFLALGAPSPLSVALIAILLVPIYFFVWLSEYILDNECVERFFRALKRSAESFADRICAISASLERFIDSAGGRLFGSWKSLLNHAGDTGSRLAQRISRTR